MGGTSIFRQYFLEKLILRAERFGSLPLSPWLDHAGGTDQCPTASPGIFLPEDFLWTPGLSLPIHVADWKGQGITVPYPQQS